MKQDYSFESNTRRFALIPKPAEFAKRRDMFRCERCPDLKSISKIKNNRKAEDKVETKNNAG